MKARDFIPQLLATITRTSRDKVLPGRDFEWSTQSWTHNAFRMFEMVCGRRSGIRRECVAWFDRATGRSYQVSFTWENRVAVLEGAVRALLASWKFEFVIVPIPQYAYAGFGISPLPRIFSFAIARDAHAAGTHQFTTSTSWNHTCTGSNLTLFVLPNWYQGNGQSNSCSYNSSAITSVAVSDSISSLSDYVLIYYKQGPATGTNSTNISISGTTRWNDGFSVSYSGTSQTADLTAKTTSSKTSSTTNSFSITPSTSTGWIVAIGACSNANTLSAGTGLTGLDSLSGARYRSMDSNGAVTGGSAYSMSVTVDTTGGDQQIAAAAWFDVPAVAGSYRGFFNMVAKA